MFETLFAATVIALVVASSAWIWTINKRAASITASPIKLVGDGSFSVTAVIEDRYRHPLERIIEFRGSWPIIACKACLEPEPRNPHDKKTIAVYIDGVKVGRLQRSDAARCYKRLRYRGLPIGPLEVDAQIRRIAPQHTAGRGAFGVYIDV